jgi:hypothetical protein
MKTSLPANNALGYSTMLLVRAAEWISYPRCHPFDGAIYCEVYHDPSKIGRPFQGEFSVTHYPGARPLGCSINHLMVIK